MNDTIFTSIEEVKKHYFPKRAKREEWDKIVALSPEEAGRELARLALEKIARSQDDEHRAE